MAEQFYVRIVEYETEEIVKQMGPFPERWAEKMDDGANINLNHDAYYTIILTQSEIDDERRKENESKAHGQN